MCSPKRGPVLPRHPADLRRDREPAVHQPSVQSRCIRLVARWISRAWNRFRLLRQLPVALLSNCRTTMHGCTTNPVEAPSSRPRGVSLAWVSCPARHAGGVRSVGYGTARAWVCVWTARFSSALDRVLEPHAHRAGTSSSSNPEVADRLFAPVVTNPRTAVGPGAVVTSHPRPDLCFTSDRRDPRFSLIRTPTIRRPQPFRPVDPTHLRGHRAGDFDPVTRTVRRRSVSGPPSASAITCHGFSVNRDLVIPNVTNPSSSAAPHPRVSSIAGGRDRPVPGVIPDHRGRRGGNDVLGLRTAPGRNWSDPPGHEMAVVARAVGGPLWFFLRVAGGGGTAVPSPCAAAPAPVRLVVPVSSGRRRGRGRRARFRCR